MTNLGESFLLFILREYLYEKNVFLVAKKIERTFNFEITPASVRGWFKLFSLEGRIVQNPNNSYSFRVKSERLSKWLHPNNTLLLSMCKELISFRKDLEFPCKIEKTLYDLSLIHI